MVMGSTIIGVTKSHRAWRKNQEFGTCYFVMVAKYNSGGDGDFSLDGNT